MPLQAAIRRRRAVSETVAATVSETEETGDEALNFPRKARTRREARTLETTSLERPIRRDFLGG